MASRYDMPPIDISCLLAGTIGKNDPLRPLLAPSVPWIKRIKRTGFLVDERERNVYFDILDVNVRGLALPVASHGAFSAGVQSTCSPDYRYCEANKRKKSIPFYSTL